MALKAPLLKPALVKARLQFAKDHLDDPEESWEKVMWSDETKIEPLVIIPLTVFGGRRMMRTIPRTPSLL